MLPQRNKLLEVSCLFPTQKIIKVEFWISEPWMVGKCDMFSFPNIKYKMVMYLSPDGLDVPEEKALIMSRTCFRRILTHIAAWTVLPTQATLQIIVSHIFNWWLVNHFLFWFYFFISQFLKKFSWYDFSILVGENISENKLRRRSMKTRHIEDIPTFGEKQVETSVYFYKTFSILCWLASHRQRKKSKPLFNFTFSLY